MAAHVTPRVALPRTASVALGPLALGGLLAAGVAICLMAAGAPAGLIPASWQGMPGWMAGPLPGLGDGLTGGEFAPLFVAMCACYVGALVVHLEARHVVIAIVLLHVSFLLAPPLLSSDVFGYIHWARLGTLHGLDPYAHGSLGVPHDEALRYFRWRTEMGSPYGPLFTIAGYATAPLGVGGAYWAFKLACTAASLGIVGLVAACARRLGGDPVRAAAFVGLNPIVLVWAVGGAHNDLLPTLAVTAGVWFALASREWASGAALVAGAAMKASAGIVLPYALIGSRRRVRALTGAVIAGVAITLAALAVFGTDVTGFVESNRDQQHMVARTSVPNQVGIVLGAGGITPAIRALAFAALVIALAWTLVRTWRGAHWIASAGWATVALIVCSAWLMPWYVVWLLPLAALARDRRLMLATIALCAYMVAVRTPF
jgi:alpha-1,6-mannosyltransferase